MSVVAQFLSWIHPEDQDVHLEPRSFYLLCKKDPEAAKKLLRTEYRGLVDELERLISTVEQRISVFAERLKKSTTDSLEQDYLLLLRQREELLKLIERIALSELSTTALQEEWADWQRYFGEVAAPDERARQRMQLVRSELAMRGVTVGDMRRSLGASRPMVETKPVVARCQIKVKTFIEPEQDRLMGVDEQGLSLAQDDLDEWKPLGEALEQAVGFWNRQFEMLLQHSQAYTPEQAAEIVSQYRWIHQRFVQQDRMQGVRRYRVGHVV